MGKRVRKSPAARLGGLGKIGNLPFPFLFTKTAMSRKIRHHNVPTDFHAESETEALILEQALAFYREIKAVAENAPDGQVLAQAEADMKMEFLCEGFTLIEQRLKELEKVEWKPREREEIRKLRGYLNSQRERLNYHERLSEGRAIGSGQVEGACKNRIGRRLKQTGAKWLISRLNRMTVLCAVRYSNHWKKYWIRAT